MPMHPVALKKHVLHTQGLREKYLADPYRPTDNIIAPEGVQAPFDPNGAIFWKGRYHLMYIVQTEKGQAWAHISSTDLLHQAGSLADGSDQCLVRGRFFNHIAHKNHFYH